VRWINENCNMRPRIAKFIEGARALEISIYKAGGGECQLCKGTQLLGPVFLREIRGGAKYRAMHPCECHPIRRKDPEAFEKTRAEQEMRFEGITELEFNDGKVYDMPDFLKRMESERTKTVGSHVAAVLDDLDDVGF